MSQVRVAHERNLDTLLLDSTYFLVEAGSLGLGDEKGQSLARASIMFSLLMLEAAANTCIEHLDLARSIHNDIDRLPIVAKFDFYLRTRFRNKFLPRDSHQIEWLRELKLIRDGLVHLKPHKIEWIGPEDREQSAKAEKTTALKISINPKFWGADDAVNVAKGVHGFLKFYFKECCGYGPAKVASLLFSESSIPGGDDHFYPCVSTATRRSLKHLGIDVSYVRTV